MMNQEDIFKKIGHILNELNDQYQYLARNPEDLNELELELFLANANFLSDHVQIIRKLNTAVAPKVLPEHTETVMEETEERPVVSLDAVEEPAVKEPVVAETAVAAPEVKPIAEQEIFKPDNEISSFEFILNDKPLSDRFEFEEKSVDEIFDRPLSKEEELIIAQKQKLREKDSLATEITEEDEIGPEPFLVSTPAASNESQFDEIPAESKTSLEEEIILDEKPAEVPEFTKEPEITTTEPQIEEVKAAEPVAEIQKPAPVAAPAPTAKLTLNDILSGNAQQSAPKPEGHRAAVTDLKQAISLNDKLRYIRDLFNGYNLAYAEAIDLLNKMPDFKTADAFLQNNYAVKHNWADKQETADQFYELLSQRFPAK